MKNMKKKVNKTIALIMSVAMTLGIVLSSFPALAQGTDLDSQSSNKIEGISDTRTTLNFNSDWGYYMGDLDDAEKVDYDDSEFANISLPHTMRLEKKHAGSVNSVYQGIGWYRRYFTIDEQFEGKVINIDFEGVMTDSDIYLNGEKLFTRNGGYVGFSVDITDKVLVGETNVIAVRVSSFDSPDTPPGKPAGNLDFHYYGGIYRDVELRITDPLRITDVLQADEIASGGVFVSYPDANKENATVNVKTHVANDNQNAANTVVKNRLVDTEGNTVAEAEDVSDTVQTGSTHQFEQEFKVKSPNLWHPDTPYLYTLISEVYSGDIKVDSLENKVGLRQIEMKPDGCYVNGEKLYLRGANRHQSYAYVGDAASDSMQVRDAIQLKENGFNSVRATHYPQSPAFLDACDEIGLLVVACQPGWQNFTNTELFYQNTIRDIRELVRRDRNHPSVILWEASLNETNYSAKWAEEAAKTAHDEYPGDQMFTAADYGLHGQYYDVNYKVVDDRFGDQDPEKPVFTREWGDWAGRDQAMRKNGEAAMIKQVDTHQGYLNGSGYPDWGGLDACERMGGYFLWSWNDYARGCCTNTLPSGNVEVDRTEKYMSSWLKSMQSARNPAYGPMVYIASQYNASSSKTINVYSNCDSVKLYQNGTLIDELTREDMTPSAKPVVNKGGSPIYKFTLSTFEEGELTAEGILDGNIVTTHEVKTPKAAKTVSIEMDDRGIAPVADGSDLIPLYFNIVDENGTLITNYNKKIHISVLGEGELVGQGISRIGVEDQTPEAGVGYAFVRTTKTAGKITVIATVDGLGSVVKEIETTPYTGSFVPDGEHIKWTGGVEKFESDLVNYENLALNKPATASSEQGGRGASFAVDGDDSTRWCASGSSMPQWLQVDLGKVEDILGFNMMWESSGLIYQYKIEVSDDGNEWEVVVDKSENDQINGDETQLVSTKARYVRLNISYIKDKNWASLFEFRVLSEPDYEEELPGEILSVEQIKSAKASHESELDREPDKLFDGETLIGTGWLSATDEVPQSVTVTFKEPQNLSGSQIYWEKDSSWYTYDLEVSTDGENWTKALDTMIVGGQMLKPVEFSQIYQDVKHVRVTIHDVLSGGGGKRIGMAELIFYTKEVPTFVYLSDLDWVNSHSDYSSVKKDTPAYGTTISLNSKDGIMTFEKGIGADTNSYVVYDITNQGYGSFESFIGINRGASKNGGEAIFTFYVDDQLVYTSPVMMRDDNCVLVKFDIPKDAKVLRMDAKWSGNQDNPEARYNTHVMWADAKLVYPEKEDPTIPEDLDTSFLEFIINYAEKLIEDNELENTMPVIVERFHEELTKSKALLEKALANPESVTQEEIDKVGKDLLDIITMIDFKANKDLLQNLVALSGKYAADKDLYRPATYTPFETALAAAKAVLADESAFQDEIDAAWFALANGVAGLRKIPNKDALKGLLNKAKSIDSSKYTVASFAMLVDATDDANIVFDDKNATEKTVDSSEKAMKTAMDGLVPLGATTTDDTDTNGTTTTKASDSDKAIKVADTTTKAAASVPKTGENLLVLFVILSAAIALVTVLLVRKREQKDM